MATEVAIGVENSSLPDKISFWWFEMLTLGFTGAGRQKSGTNLHRIVYFRLFASGFNKS